MKNTATKSQHIKDILASTHTHAGNDLMSLSQKQPIMLVFLRHFGCTFCREVLRDLGKTRQDIEEIQGTKIVLVHMSPPEYAEKMLAKFNLSGTEHIGDPTKQLYQAFELKRGTLKQLFGLKMWVRGFQVGVLEGLWVGRERGDGFQMPGFFILKDGEVVHEYVSQDAADHPDYLQLIS